MDNSSASAIGVVAVGVLLYFIPTIIGWKKRNAVAIIAVNILLGWTVIGWLAALVWATHETKLNMPVNQRPLPLPPPGGLLCSSCAAYSAFGSKFCSHCGALLATPLNEKSARQTFRAG
jgi:hypothetical protein